MKKGGKKTGQEKTEVEQKPEVELSVQELMQQEAAKRRAAMGYDEENTELEEESVVKKPSVEKEPKLSVQQQQEQQQQWQDWLKTPKAQEKWQDWLQTPEAQQQWKQWLQEVHPQNSNNSLFRQWVEAQQQQPSNLAQDSVIFGPENDPKLSVTVSDVVDPITQAIREEIIKKQQLLLQEEIAKTLEEPVRTNFQKQDLTALRAYLASEQGKKDVSQVMQNPALQTQMHGIELAGYKAVHSKFQDSFRNVDWGQLGTNKIRTTNITNDAGEAVCTLKETTIDTAPTSLVLDNGKTIAVKSYRQIDFPKELKTGNGPMHVSMALKDENGRNMPEKDAVYFTAHYDDSGKLTEVSSPVPVKFMGKGDDAIGYIERNGKVFTLPVTQGKYHEMMQEVAKNQGMNVDISQSVAEPQQQAQDKVTVIQPHQQQHQHQQPQQQLSGTMPPQPSQVSPQYQQQQQPPSQPLRPSILLAPDPEQFPSHKPPTKLKNAFGEEVDPKVKAQTEQIKSGLGYSSSNASNAQIPSELSQQVEKSEKQVFNKAVGMLSGKNDKEAQKIISTAAKDGDADLVAAMVEAVSNPPKDKGVPAVSSTGLKMVYEEAMSNRGVNKSQKARIERACGQIAPKAGIADHMARVSSVSIARG